MNTWQYDHTTFRGRRAFATLQRRTLEEAGLSPDEVELAMTPLVSFHAGFDEEQGTIMTDPTTTAQYLGWAGSPKQPIADTVIAAIAAFTARMGTAPREVLVHVAVVSEVHAAHPGLAIDGRDWIQPGHVLLR